ncbi:hypothetical protein QQS21_006605 [Conoideocrella luteorostrata]|uniref:Beta-lactamase family protein n=1 Tax=Conoideocrella luteorostrata TaxID=1105319 RepID=A0AAJ0G022_9HYPO|nr:hypothetical protein QQS21_006605 [Conoideocrella luteorostrata]
MDLLESSLFTDLISDLMRQYHIPGLSIAVVRNGEVASSGFGRSHFHDPFTPCTGDTLYDIASSSKSLTAASVALLVDDKDHPDMQYDALMSRLLPEDFVMQNQSHTDGVTVEDVLSHRTGMAGHDNSYMGEHAAQPDNAKTVTRNLRNLKEAAPLRSRYLYCNMMYTVAAHLVEEKSKKRFSEFLEERIFDPLQMNSTTLQPKSAYDKGWKDRMAQGHIWENHQFRAVDAQDCPEGQGAGSVISSANDFIKWVKALLYREGPINDKVYQGLTKMRSIVNPNARRLRAHTTPANYTAGMEIYFYRGSMVVGHDGNIPGFSSRFIFMPDKKFGAVVLGNSADARGASTTIMRALMDEVLGVPIAERPFLNNNSNKNRNGPKRVATIHPKQSKDHAEDQAQTQKNADNTKAEAKVKNKTKGESQNKSGGNPQKRKTISPPQETPLKAYVGNYRNAGYHNLKVEIKDNQLFIDATDRSMGFTMKFRHVNDQTKYIGHLIDDIKNDDELVDAEFQFDGERVLKLGLDLEPVIKELIWFEHCGNSG